MISFLNGFLLPALFAATIPLILHFLSKKKARKVPFSSLRFLKIIENHRIKRVKLFQILLIIVRTLFIIFLVLAFSRPAISTYSGASNAQTTAVIIIDDSYSMQSFAYSKTYFELARESIVQLFKSFAAEDRVFLYSSAMDRPAVITTENHLQILSELTAGNRVLDLQKNLAVADSVFRENPNLNNELYFISDFKIEAVELDSALFSGIGNYKAYALYIPGDIPFRNISIDTVIIENQLFELNKPFNITVRLTNHDQQNNESNINLYNGDERVSMEFTSLAPSQTKTLDVKYIPRKEGIHFLRLQLEEDDLSADNTWFLSFYMRDEIKSLFISDKTTPAMQTALKILEQNTIFSINKAGVNEWPGTNLFNYDLVIFNDFNKTDNAALEKLKDFMQQGRSVIIIPGSSATINDYNTFFSSIAESPVFDRLMESQEQGYYSLENQKSANLIFNYLFRDKQSAFSPPKLYKYFKQKNYSQGLIHLTNGDAYLTQTRGLLVFGSSFSDDWSDMEVNGLFLPLLYRSFYHASQSKKPVSEMHNIGDLITFSMQGATIDKNYFIQNADGKKFSVIPRPVINNLLFNGGVAEEPGFYILLDEDEPQVVKAINHSPAELKKPFWHPQDLDFKNISPQEESFIENIQNARLGFELWLICLILSFIMVMAEMIIIKIIEGTPFPGKS